MTLREIQAPLKAKYKEQPESAFVTLHAEAILGANVTAEIKRRDLTTGLHPATGGTGEEACSGDMLLQALVACAGVTLKAVSTSMGLPIRAGAVLAEGDLDFRGTLGVSREVLVGFSAIRLRFELDLDATDEQ